METIALVGAGKMGSAIAERLRLAGYAMRVFDRSPERRAQSASRGLTVGQSIAEICTGADWVLLCLPDAQAVEQAVCGTGGLLQSSSPPRMCIDLTSSSPATTVRLAGILAERGISLLDAPMSGGVAGARAGKLTVMLGGNPSEGQRLEPLLKSIASHITWAGPLGSGHAAKAINNALSALSLTVTAEMLTTGAALGCTVDRLIKVFNQGMGRSQNSEVKYPQFILNGTFASEFLLSQMLKDIGVASEMARDQAIPLLLTATLGQVWTMALERLGHSADSTQIAQFLGVCSNPAGQSGAHGAADSEKLSDGLLASLGLAVYATCLVGAAELLRLAERYQLKRKTLLSIVNASSGRSEATRDLERVAEDSKPLHAFTLHESLDALDGAHAAARSANVFVPTSTVAAEFIRLRAQTLGHEADLRMVANGAAWPDVTSPRLAIDDVEEGGIS